MWYSEVIVTAADRIVCMESTATSRGNAAIAGFELVDFSELGSSDLIKQILQADMARRQLDGYLAALLGRLGELEGDEAVAAVCSQFGISGYKARKQAKTAGVLKGLPNTLQAAKDGWIAMDHAQLLAESHARAPLAPEEELELITLAIKQDCDRFRKTVAAMEDQRQAVDGLSRTERQRARRFAKVFDGDYDMVVVYAELERIAGERVKAALESLNSQMLRDDTATGDERTFEQRNADALVALVTQQPTAKRTGQRLDADAAADTEADRADTGEDACAGEDADTGEDACAGEAGCGEATETGQADTGNGAKDDEVGGGDLAPQKTELIVTVDYDALTGKLENAGLIDGTPIDVDELRRIACDADIVPAIFSADGQPLHLGRKQRAVTQAQRLALYRRDRGCIGCGLRPTACDAHHIKWWDQGGPTDITNLVLLCPKCHSKVHKHGYTVEQDPDTERFILKPPSKYRPNPWTPTRAPRRGTGSPPGSNSREQAACC